MLISGLFKYPGSTEPPPGPISNCGSSEEVVKGHQAEGQGLSSKRSSESSFSLVPAGVLNLRGTRPSSK